MIIAEHNWHPVLFALSMPLVIAYAFFAGWLKWSGTKRYDEARKERFDKRVAKIRAKREKRK